MPASLVRNPVLLGGPTARALVVVQNYRTRYFPIICVRFPPPVFCPPKTRLNCSRSGCSTNMGVTALRHQAARVERILDVFYIGFCFINIMRFQDYQYFTGRRRIIFAHPRVPGEFSRLAERLKGWVKLLRLILLNFL